jgi:hypothetical protein
MPKITVVPTTKTEDRMCRVAVIVLVTVNFQPTLTPSDKPILSKPPYDLCDDKTHCKPCVCAEPRPPFSLTLASVSAQLYQYTQQPIIYRDCQLRWYCAGIDDWGKRQKFAQKMFAAGAAER